MGIKVKDLYKRIFLHRYQFVVLGIFLECFGGGVSRTFMRKSCETIVKQSPKKGVEFDVESPKKGVEFDRLLHNCFCYKGRRVKKISHVKSKKGRFANHKLYHHLVDWLTLLLPIDVPIVCPLPYLTCLEASL